MDNNEQERDTHFLGFANLLAKELLEWEVESMDEYKTRIARRAYDLVWYTLDLSQDEVYYKPDWLIAERVPDFTEWPPKPEEPQ